MNYYHQWLVRAQMKETKGHVNCQWYFENYDRGITCLEGTSWNQLMDIIDRFENMDNTLPVWGVYMNEYESLKWKDNKLCNSLPCFPVNRSHQSFMIIMVPTEYTLLVLKTRPQTWTQKRNFERNLEVFEKKSDKGIFL